MNHSKITHIPEINCMILKLRPYNALSIIGNICSYHDDYNIYFADKKMGQGHFIPINTFPLSKTKVFISKSLLIPTEDGTIKFIPDIYDITCDTCIHRFKYQLTNSCDETYDKL